MVSFYCETCCATLKKPKLDQHAQRCWAVFTCIDCSTTFQDTDYRSHTSCITEAEKYEKSVYKGPKHKAQAKPAATPVAAAEPAPQAKRARDDDATSAAAPAAIEVDDNTPSLKKQKKDAKKAAKIAAKAAAQATAADPSSAAIEQEQLAAAEAAARAAPTEAFTPIQPEAGAGAGDATAGTALAVALEGPDLKGFLRVMLDELVKEARSVAGLREVVLEKAKQAGFVEEKEVEKALFEAVWVGGEKPKKRLDVRL